MNARSLAWTSTLIGSVCIAIGVAQLESAPTRPAQPAVTATTRRVIQPLGDHDFGRLVGTTQREHELHLRNPGPQPWRVVKTWQDCGCVSIVSASEGDVPPGSNLVVRIRIDTEGQPMGRIARRFHVLLDPGGVQYTGNAVAECYPAPNATPSVLETTIDRNDGAFVAECEFRVPDLGTDIEVEVVDPPADVQVDVAETSATPPTRNYLVQVNGMMPESLDLHVFAVFLRVRGVEGLEGEQLVKIPCYVRRTRELAPSPRVVVLDAASPELAARLFVKNDKGEPIDGLRWTDEPAGRIAATYDATTGCMSLRVKDGSTDDVSLTLSAPSGETAVVPIEFDHRAER